MEFNRSSKKKFNSVTANDYEHSPNLQLYSVPPIDTISLQEFEELALDRLKVLKAVETIGIRHVRGTNEYRDAMRAELAKHSWTKLKAAEACRKDHISHFILRLAYCKTEDLRRWFIAQELDLFRHRFLQLSGGKIQEFLRSNNLSYVPISKDEKLEVLDQLKDSRSNMSESDVESSDYYKVPFTDALELVRSSRVFIKRGFAYVPHSELVVIIQSVFRTVLSHALVITSRIMPGLAEEDRLDPLLMNLSRQYVGHDYGNKKFATDHFTADMIDTLAKTSFPLCMQQLHSSLRLNHHLKHWGRQQYGLFLKGIGLPLEEALKFWRTEFTRIMDSDKFDKQYAYNVRHNYGKEGKRADYTPYSCVKIITSNAPSAGDFHGCPFRHSDAESLRLKMQSLNVSKDGITEVVDLVKQGHFQVACGRYFELKHNADYKFAPQHPNQYFEESRKVLSGDQSNASAGARSQGGAVIVPVRQAGQHQTSLPSQSSAKNCGNGTDFDEFGSDEDLATVSLAGIAAEAETLPANADFDTPFMECDA